MAFFAKQGSTWKTATKFFVKQGSTWKPILKAYIKQGANWVQFWPKSGPYTTTAPYFSTDTSGNSTPAGFTLSVGSTYYLQKGVWVGNGGTISSYVSNIYTTPNSDANTGGLTLTSGPTSLINYTSITLNAATYDGFYIVGQINATRTDGIVGTDTTDSNGYRYFVMRKYSPKKTNTPTITSQSSLTESSVTGGDLVLRGSPTTLAYKGYWDGTSDYLPDSTRSFVTWYSSTNGSYTTSDQIIANATYVSGSLSSVTNTGGVYTASASITLNTITSGTYYYAVNNEYNSNSDWNVQFGTNPPTAIAVIGPIKTSPQSTTYPTLTSVTPSGYNTDNNFPGNSNSFMVGSTITGNTGSWSPTPSGVAPFSSAFLYSNLSSISLSNISSWKYVTLPSSVYGFFGDASQNQNHSFTLGSLVDTSVNSIGKYLSYEVYTQDGDLTSALSEFYTTPKLLHDKPHTTNIGGITYSQSDGSLSITSLSFPDSTTSYAYQLQYAPYQGSWTNLGSIKYQSSLSLIGYSYLKYAAASVPSGNYYYRILAYNDDNVYIVGSTYGPVSTIKIPVNTVAPYWTDTSGNSVSSPYYAGTYRLNFGTWSNSPTYYRYQIYYNNQAGTIITQDYSDTYTNNYVDYTFPINTNTISANVYAGNAGALSTFAYPPTFGPIVGVQTKPTLGTPTSTTVGFYVSITNYDSAATYTVNQVSTTSTSTPSYSVSGSTVYVTNTSPSSSTSINVTARKTGYVDSTSNTVSATTIAQPGAFTYSIIDTSANRGPNTPVVTSSVSNNVLTLNWSTTTLADQYREYLTAKSGTPIAYSGYYPGGATSTFTSDTWNIQASGTETITVYAYNTLNGQIAVTYGGSSNADYYQILYQVGTGAVTLSPNLTSGNIFFINATIGTAVTIYSVVAWNNAGGSVGGTLNAASPLTSPATPTTKSTSVTNDYVLTYTPPSYTVTWNANGGSVSPTSSTVTAGGSVTAPTPTLSGYTFNGWYDSASGGKQQVTGGGSYTPSSSITLYAQWTAIIVTYTVTWNANGGSVSPTSSTVNAGSSITAPTPTRSGYTMAGWYDAASGGNLIVSSGFSYTPGSSITLYAHWNVVVSPPSTPTYSAYNYGTSTHTGTPSITMSSTGATTIYYQVWRTATGTGAPNGYGNGTYTQVYPNGVGGYASVNASSAVVNLDTIMLNGTLGAYSNGYYYVTAYGSNSGGSSSSSNSQISPKNWFYY